MLGKKNNCILIELESSEALNWCTKLRIMLFIVPIQNDVILAYQWSIKMYTGLTMVI